MLPSLNAYQDDNVKVIWRYLRVVQSKSLIFQKLRNLQKNIVTLYTDSTDVEESSLSLWINLIASTFDVLSIRDGLLN